MRSVVLSIAVHVVLGAIVVLRVTTRADVVVTEEPRVTEIELYVEPPTAKPEIVATNIPASHASHGSHAPHAPSHTVRSSATHATVETTLTKTSEPPPSPVEAPRVVALPSPHDAAETVSIPAAKSDGVAAPTTTSSNTFRMRVDADGSAHISDRRNFQWGRGDITSRIQEVTAERWLETHHEQSNVVDMKMPELTTVARFDVTDAAMRLAGQDPYAYEKLKALDATRDERAKIGARHHERQLLDTPALVRASLADIARLPADQRAAAITALYLDCDDSPAGEIARATIADYVRAQGLAIELRRR